MRVIIVADTYSPLRTSGAVQLRDLSREFVAQGHSVTMLVAAPDLAEHIAVETDHGVDVVRVRTPPTKDIPYLRRMANELLMPFAMHRAFRRLALAKSRYDLVIWYSPTIFLGPIVRRLKRQSRCRSYLIIRDIFPQWAADMGLLRRGPAFYLLNAVAHYQYRSADVIGVQSPGNLAFFRSFRVRHPGIGIEVLPNWLAEPTDRASSIRLSETALAGRRFAVYAGNMGVAQQMDKLIDLATALRERSDLGFTFVGRGSEAARLRSLAASRDLDNVLFFEEIDPDEIPALYAQCAIGLLSLDSRHVTHNIPGKFLSYMQCGLPVLATVNANNDLVEVVTERQVGAVSVARHGEDLPKIMAALLDQVDDDPNLAKRCRTLFAEIFSVAAAVRQITAAAHRDQ